MKKAVSIIEAALITTIIAIVAISFLNITNTSIMDLSKKTTTVKIRN